MGLCMQRLNADEFIDYKTQRFDDVLKGQQFDLIVDVVGGLLCPAPAFHKILSSKLAVCTCRHAEAQLVSV